mmetsp:Transcript_6380/g.20522  ORF Transcript_6380/g.20522 Transcript_6380/m.20522 type:complete len:297 (+) Transcript_6380:66-956(+)
MVHPLTSRICDLAFVIGLHVVAGADAVAGGCHEGVSSCRASSLQPGADHLLVQTRRDLTMGRGQANVATDADSVAEEEEEVFTARARHHGERVDGNLTSGCASRLGHGRSHASACLVVRDGKVLMVRVPYGRRPGWDFPGGRAHSGEAPCETAEREACEETGYGVRAVGRLSRSVFRCEIVALGVCTRPVDEGFLEKGWFSRHETGAHRHAERRPHLGEHEGPHRWALRRLVQAEAPEEAELRRNKTRGGEDVCTRWCACRAHTVSRGQLPSAPLHRRRPEEREEEFDRPARSLGL